MIYFIIGFQVISGVALIILILLHSAKGEGLGGIGGSATLFTGPTQAEAGLDKLTWATATVFMFTSALVGWGIIRL